MVAAFLHDEWRPVPRRALSGGIRVQHLRLDGDYTAPKVISADDCSGVPGTFGTEHHTSRHEVLLGSAAAVFTVAKKTNLKFNFAQGFRPPHLFDLVFDLVKPPER